MFCIELAQCIFHYREIAGSTLFLTSTASENLSMSRWRTMGYLTNVPPLHEERMPVSCANRTLRLADYPIAGVEYGDKKVTQDEITPNFNARRKRGEFIFNPFYSVRTQNILYGSSTIGVTSVANLCTGPNLKWTWTYTGPMLIYEYVLKVGNPVNVHLLDGAVIESLRTEVWTRCMAERQSGQTNLTESLAEMDKTFAMVGNPLENVARFVKDFRRNGKRKKGFSKVSAQSKDVIVFLSSEWLRFRYGITPLMNDVKAGMKALKEHRSDAKAMVYKARANGSIVPAPVTTTGSAVDGWLSFTWSKVSSHTVSVRAVHYDKYTKTTFNKLGLTFQNVVGLSWELTHFSFVVDWFANIGDLIYANIPRVGVQSLGGSMTMKQDTRSLFSPTSSSNADPATYTMFGSLSDSYLMWKTETTRTVGDSLSEGLVIKSDFRFDTFNRAADAAALVSQLLSSIKF